MGYYGDAYMANKPEYELIGTYFGKHNAEDTAKTFSTTHDTIITYSYTTFDKFDFYSVWGRKLSIKEILIRDGVFDYLNV